MLTEGLQKLQVSNLQLFCDFCFWIQSYIFFHNKTKFKTFLNSLFLKNKKVRPMTNLFCFGGEQGIFRDYRLYRLASLVATVGKNSPQDCFLPLRSLLVRIPFIIYKKQKSSSDDELFCFGGEQGIRTLEQVIARYTISNRAPSASSDNSPNILLAYYNLLKYKLQVKFLYVIIKI